MSESEGMINHEFKVQLAVDLLTDVTHLAMNS